MVLVIGILTAGDAMANEELAYCKNEQEGPFERRVIEPPFMRWFLRRNEIPIEIREPEVANCSRRARPMSTLGDPIEAS